MHVAVSLFQIPQDNHGTFHAFRKYRHLRHKGRTLSEHIEYLDFSLLAHLLDLRIALQTHHKAVQQFRLQLWILPFHVLNVRCHYQQETADDNIPYLNFSEEFLPVLLRGVPYHIQEMC